MFLKIYLNVLFPEVKDLKSMTQTCSGYTYGWTCAVCDHSQGPRILLLCRATPDQREVSRKG